MINICGGPSNIVFAHVHCDHHVPQRDVLVVQRPRRLFDSFPASQKAITGPKSDRAIDQVLSLPMAHRKTTPKSSGHSLIGILCEHAKQRSLGDEAYAASSCSGFGTKA